MTKENFWNWFDNNKVLLETFILSDSRDYTIYETLSDKLKEYNEYLIPELTMTEDNRFVLVVSCDGIKQGIPFVETLTENLKTFTNWQILKYRQAGPMDFIPINELDLKRSNIFLQWKKNNEQKYILTFFVKGYNANDPNYETGTLLHLDHTIGEFNSMTKIADVTIKKLGLLQSKKDLKTLDDLSLELNGNFS